MKKTLCTLVFVLLTSQMSFAQVKFEDFVTGLADNFSNDVIRTKQAVETTGTPYLMDDEWMKGQLVTANQKSELLNMRFNLAENAFEVENKGSIVIVDTYLIKAVEIQSPKKITLKNGFMADKDENIDKATMFEVLYEGDMILLKRDYANFSKGVASYGSATRKDVYSKSTRYYAFKDGEYHRIKKLRSKDLLKFYDKSTKKDVEKFAKENKLSFKNKSDLKKILNYAESM